MEGGACPLPLDGILTISYFEIRQRLNQNRVDAPSKWTQIHTEECIATNFCTLGTRQTQTSRELEVLE